MNDLNFYIRFGVHKERQILNQMREYITGLCIPGHILSYSQDPTIAAIKYVDKPYFIDPMTYVYAAKDFPKYLAKKENKKGEKEIKFKPSIQKLTVDMGLVDFFEGNSYSPIRVDDLDDNLIRTIAKNAIQIQKNKVNDGKEVAIKRYSELLKLAEGNGLDIEVGTDISPQFLVSPYFYFSDVNDGWYLKNKTLFTAAKEECGEDYELVPFIMTEASSLSPEILEGFSADKYILWLTDFDPKSNSTSDQQINKLRNLKNFIEYAGRNGKKIIDMYGSYYSIILSKSGGLDGLCNGVLHGESKSKDATIGGGAPPVRFYLRKIHEFLPVLEAIAVLRDDNGKDLLDIECKECNSIVEGSVSKLDLFVDNPELAQKHFIHSRICEIEFVESHDIDTVLSDMDTYSQIFIENFEDKIKKSISGFISNWQKTLSE